MKIRITKPSGDELAVAKILCKLMGGRHLHSSELENSNLQQDFKHKPKVVKVLKFINWAASTKYLCQMDDGTQILLTATEIGNDPAMEIFKKKMRVFRNHKAYIKRRERKVNDE